MRSRWKVSVEKRDRSTVRVSTSSRIHPQPTTEADGGNAELLSLDYCAARKGVRISPASYTRQSRGGSGRDRMRGVGGQELFKGHAK